LLDRDTTTKKFDLVFIAGVFHHIAPELREGAIKSVFDLMNLSGEVFIYEHNPYNPVTVNMVNDCPYDADAVLLKPNELRSLTHSVGLQVANFRYTLFIPGFLKRIRFLEKYLMWLPLG
jgi:hypothetical protein